MSVAGNRVKESTKRRGTAAAAEGIVRNTKSTAERLLVTGRPKTTSSTPTDKSGGMLEDIINPLNLEAAYKRVKSNGGSGGVDRMTVDELLPYLKLHGDEIAQDLLDGRYMPCPVRRVEIPKDNGKMRQLGIPTAVDRVIQQAIAQVLTPVYEPQFVNTTNGNGNGRRGCGERLLKLAENAG